MAFTSILLVEQNARQALRVAHRGYVLETGRVVLADTGRNLLENPKVIEAYLGGGETRVLASQDATRTSRVRATSVTLPS